MDYIDNCPIGNYTCTGCNYLSTCGCSHPNKYKQKEDFIEIPFGARDSETLGWEYTIPDDMEATIKDGKIIVKKKESEDEKIRGKLLQWLKLKLSNPKVGFVCEEMKQWIAYLEKQKPVENNYPSYNPDEYESFEDGNATGLRKKQKPVEWSEEDEKMLSEVFTGLSSNPNVNINKYNKLSNWLKSLKPKNR